MNYLAHGLSFLDRPYVLAGTAVPDWLSVTDRALRLRAQQLRGYQLASDRPASDVIAGVLTHLADDAAFHVTAVFRSTAAELTGKLRGILGEGSGVRVAFVGHLLVELLLDAVLAAEVPGLLDSYYTSLARAEASLVESAVNGVAPRETKGLAAFMAHFVEARVLSDYLEDGKLLARVNQVMVRIRFGTLPESVRTILPWAREFVAARRCELMRFRTEQSGEALGE